jgi:hypothetical protein
LASALEVFVQTRHLGQHTDALADLFVFLPHPETADGGFAGFP